MTDVNLNDSLKQWLKLDTQIRLANQQIRDLRKEKDSVANTVCDHMKTHGMEKRRIEAPDSRIELYEKKEYSTLTYGFLEKHLGDIIPDSDNVKQIIDYLKSKREVKKSMDLKRIFNTGIKRGTAKAQESSGYDTE